MRAEVNTSCDWHVEGYGVNKECGDVMVGRNSIETERGAWEPKFIDINVVLFWEVNLT